jgi:hypothetical protein
MILFKTRHFGDWMKEQKYNLTVYFAKYNWNDLVKEDEMVGACSMNGVRGMHID